MEAPFWFEGRGDAAASAGALGIQPSSRNQKTSE